VDKLLSKTSKKLLVLELDGEFNILVYGELNREKIKLLGFKIISLLGTDEQEKQLTEEIVKTLKDFPQKGREVFISHHSLSLYLGRFTLPDLPQKEIPQALSWQLKKVIPEKEEDIIFDYLPIKEVTDREGVKQKNYLVCLIPRREIENIISLMEKTKLEFSKITVSSLFLGSLLPSDLDPQKIYAILDFSWTASILSFYQNKKIIFSRLIPVGVKNLIQALGISIVYKGNHLSLEPEKAWQALKEIGIPETFTEEEWQGFPLSQMLILMRPELEKLSTEIIRSLEYLSSTLKEGNTEKIFLTGIGASLKGMAKNLSNYLHRPLEELNFPVETELKISLQEKAIISPSLGTFFTIFEKNINLLPPEYRLDTSSIRKIIKSISLFISLLLLGYLFIFIPKSIIYKKEINLLKKEAPKFEKLKEIKKELQQKEEIKSQLLQGKFNFTWIIQEISAVLPSQVTLTKLNIKDIRNVELSGIVFAKEFVENIIAEMMKNIENSKLLSEPKLEWLRKSPEKQIAEFKMNVRIR